ncbi:hypothetical protein [Streptomyces sp. NPDC001717]|uniref:hypothetical protein n=1 Tax=Streptomyces sp. NPDC001717 TaxID=3364604 RepID=UPI0036A3F486
MATAVTQWTEMIAKLTQLNTDASAMTAKAGKSTGRGENASVTKEFVGKTGKEFGDAVTEAEFDLSELDVSSGEYEGVLQPTARQWYQNGLTDADKRMGER